MKLVSYFAPVLLTFFFSFKSYSQSNPYFHYSVAEGLPSAETYYVFQDKKGFIWFATDNGVVRFDGNEMELFQSNEGLSDPVVFEFIEDAKERLWFRTFSGRISYFFNEKIHPYKYNDSLVSYCRQSYLESLYIDSKGQVWYGNASELGKIGASGKKEAERNEIVLNTIALKNVENEMINSFNGPNISKAMVNGKYLPTHWVDDFYHRTHVLTIKWRGNQYFSYGSAIYKIGENEITPVFHSPGRQIITISLDNSDNLWIGYYQNGLECLTDFATRKANTFNFIGSKSVTRVLQDRQGGYWISTLEDGVFYVPYDDFIEEELPPGLKINRAVSQRNSATVGDMNGSLWKLDHKGKFTEELKLGLSILAILPVSQNRLWVSTPNDTYILDELFVVKKRIQRSYSDLLKTNDGTIWAITGPRLTQFNQEGETLNEIFSARANRSIAINNHFMFRYGRLGAQAFTPDNKEVKLPSFYDALKVSKILALNDSLLLFGTLGSGFLVVNQNRWTYQQYSSKHKFTAKNVYDLINKGDEIWMGTERGVAVASVNSIIHNNPTFSFFIAKNRGGNNKISHLVSVPEKVMAFSEESLFILPKESKPSGIPVFHLQNILINNQPDSMRANQRLDFNQNNIQVNFRFIDFRNQNVQVRSRLSSTDNWNYSSDRNIKFYSLSSGNYHLEIEFSVDNIHWNKATTWDFTILPPWWKTWYFQASIIFIILWWVVLYLRRRFARANERNVYLNLINTQQQRLIRAELDTLESERNRIAKDLHDSVGTNLTAIKMTVWSILKKHDTDKAKSVDQEFQSTIREIKGIINDLVPAGLDKYGLTETVRGYAAKIEENLDIKIEVNSFGPEIKDQKLNLISFRILQELISNTLKHAHAGKVVIHINSFEDLLSILYQDNGKGFDVESVARGSGLYNIQSRVQTVHGTIKFESGSFGVSYTIDVPLNQNGNDQNHSS